MLVNHKIGVIVAMVFKNAILIIAKALYIQDVSKVPYQYTGIISTIYSFVFFETPCIYPITNLAQNYEQIC